MEQSIQNTAQVVADLVNKTRAPETITLHHPLDGTQAPVVVLSTDKGMIIKTIDELFNPYRSQPLRRQGTAEMKDLKSFINHVKRFQDEDSALFGIPDKKAPALLSVLDYHQKVNIEVSDADGMVTVEKTASPRPRFGGHRTTYKFPLSPEWSAWTAKDGDAMEQGEFAAFIEERALDILPAPIFAGDLSAADQELKRLADLLNGRFAGPERMMELSRGLSIYEASRVVNVTNIASGEGQVVFMEEHQDGEGRPIAVPNLFCIGIPVFEGDVPYRLVVRLRYRKNGSRIVWFYQLYRHDLVFNDAFNNACLRAQTFTGLPLFIGQPEA